MIWKRLKADKTGKKTWTNLIDEIVLTYNTTVNMATGMKPYDAKKTENTLQVKVNLEIQRRSTRTYKEINVGDNVRIYYKRPINKAKEHLSNWSEEKYKVESKSVSFNQAYYHLEGKKQRLPE